MYCNKCGNEIKDGDLFCASCGNKIEGINHTNETADFIEDKKEKQYSSSDTFKMEDNVDDAENGEKRKIIGSSTMETVLQQQKTSIFQRVKAFYKKHNAIIWIAIGILLLLGVGNKIYYHINPTAAVKDYYLTPIATGKDTCTVGEFADQVGGTFTATKLDNGTYNILLKYKSDYDTTFMFIVDPADENAVSVIYAYENPIDGGSSYKSDDSQECMQMLYRELEQYTDK